MLNQVYDLETIRQQVTFPQVLAYYGIHDSKIVCWLHQDDSPSLAVYENGGFCFGCRKSVDIFDLVKHREKCNLPQAVSWILAHADILPAAVRKDREVVEQVSPYSRPIIEYWHDCLESTPLAYLLGRGLTKETLDRYLIGYRPDWDAITIPYWSQSPGVGDVVGLQYRRLGFGEGPKYWWERGYRQYLSNKHFLENEFIILVYGVFDAILGEQDGLPMCGTFTHLRREEMLDLATLLQGKQGYLLPDSTASELPAAAKLCDFLQSKGVNMQLRWFPEVGKDYNEIRLAGISVEQFMEHIK